ncbi:arginase family protein [Kushneria marisflavi]|uniref:Arginase n=1 Tax=Kushneria marisflavi TaxID=157779 RepID=A0A240UUA5_9GAMM|nr:arginase family protein [Kushneria marisflavi]ART64632.1 arginase [Kushneria marisflavi]RKD84982.1 arginase [Kushneria marisflavi]
MNLILAPSNLGLRSQWNGHEPGTWRAPFALIKAGLLEALDSPKLTELPRPRYRAAPQQGTQLLNGHEMRTFNLRLAELVEQYYRQDEFVLVIGGDCSILLGALAGARRMGQLSLLHIDGHSDFRHPGNDNTGQTAGAAAGMDLALATGRGEALGTSWPDISGPLVEDRNVIQLGERENRDADFAWPDVNDTDITRIDVFEADRLGATGIIEIIDQALARQPDKGFWIHLDVDVLDQGIMPAVDSPGTPGIDPETLLSVLKRFAPDLRCIGMTVTVFDPDLDPDGHYASRIVEMLARIPFGSRRITPYE